ncbi:VPLPA-CTERM-specific exosortase XrtD [Desulfovibrio mangrovi]|uniref:VPLPA-CTERM-specific exosortase XrtD n=1 Tax=Desulfovibrio mangrovi TaxID=2976983 RepID=UPI0022464256|nr:VPLPA-CTERM-specific exosortase XrtD [Desulfovibrio mangrovi]UZP67599.1 VPLPA-CTERM-specific exosortase XrtD [Desulfovibrio mangrovi]
MIGCWDRLKDDGLSGIFGRGISGLGKPSLFLFQCLVIVGGYYFFCQHEAAGMDISLHTWLSAEECLRLCWGGGFHVGDGNACGGGVRGIFLVRQHVVFVVSMLLLGGMYFQDMQTLAGLWSGEDYSHCYLVPLMVGYLVWTDRKSLSDHTGGRPLLGFILLVFAAVLLLVGRLGALQTLVYLSMLFAILASVLIAYGGRLATRLWYPFLIALFMIPPPAFIDNLMSLRLKLISSQLAEWLLRAAFVPVYREGNLIDIGVIRLQVVDACSGLRYLWPSFLMSLLMGRLFLKKYRLICFLVLMSMPVTVIANAFRIMMAGVLAKYVDPALAEGFFHDFSGWLVYVIVLIVLGGCVYLLRSRDAGEGQSGSALVERFLFKGAQRGSVPAAWHGILAMGILVGMLAVRFFLVDTQLIQTRIAFTHFPQNIGEWQGERVFLSNEALNSLGVDDYYNGVFYSSSHKNQAHTLVAWYDTQTASRAAHAPTSCLLGGGWLMESKQVLTPNAARSFPVGQIVLSRNGRRLISNFCFLQRGRVVTSEWLNKLYLVYDGIIMHRSDGALVRVEMPLHENQSIEEGQLVLDDYVGSLRVALMSYLPKDYAH